MKKKLWKNITKLMITAAITMLLFTGCGGTEKKIIGTWAWEKYADRTIEIFDNGSAKLEHNTYQWTLSDTTITFTPDDKLSNNTEIYTIALDGDQMTLSTDKNTFVFNRVE